MNENAKKWVAALRSGNYSQAQSALRKDDSFCCLGVACEISGLGEWADPLGPADHKIYRIGQESSGGVLPQTVKDWLGLTGVMGGFEDEDGADFLTDRNDNGASFEAIADLIESEPEGLFK